MLKNLQICKMFCTFVKGIVKYNKEYNINIIFIYIFIYTYTYILTYIIHIKITTIMVTFTVNDELTINLPTSYNDITEDYLRSISNEINVAPDYALIGLIQITTLEDLCFANSKKKNSTAVVIPTFIRAGETDSKFISAMNVKDKIIINRSNIELGEHVHLKNNLLTIPTIIGYIENDDKLRHSIINRSFFTEHKMTANTKIYAVEFKIVPNNDIHGYYNDIENIVNPFVKKISK